MPHSTPPSSSPISLIPKQAGFSFPAQWSPHRATVAAWPFERGETWMVPLEDVRAEYAEFLKAIAADEPVMLLVADAECLSSFSHYLPDCPTITPIEIPLDDCWLRDSGPVVVQHGEHLLPIIWRFNAWGGKFPSEHDAQMRVSLLSNLGAPRYVSGPLTLEGGAIECNGAGIGMTTRSCVLSPERNAGLSESEVLGTIAQYYGLDRLIALDGGFQTGDHTDGHIDMAARFTSSGAVLANTTDDPTHPSAEAFRRNARDLQQAGLSVQPLPLPKQQIIGPNWGGGSVLVPANYANFYATGRSILVPQFGDPHDDTALRIIASCFPQHRVTGLPARSIVIGGGGIFNCLTQQIPQGKFYDPH